MAEMQGHRISFTPVGALESLGVLCLLSFAYSRLSWGKLIPSIGWGGILCLGTAMLIAAYIRSTRFVWSPNSIVLLFALMVLIILLNRNYDFQNIGFPTTGLPYICMFFMYLVCRRSNAWMQAAVRAMLGIGIFYGLFTVLCILHKDFYYATVVPFMSSYGTSYTANPAAGFTAHYSTNGIYLATAFCAAISRAYFGKNGRIQRFSLFDWVMLILCTVSILLAGKRGILLCLLIAGFVCYRNFTVRNKRGRFLKIFGLILLLVIVVSLVSIFAPDIAYTFNRFAASTQGGDFSNGRLALWGYAWEQFLSAPLTGLGWRWFLYHNPIMPQADAHNVFLQLLLENGIIGAIPFFLFFALSYIRAYKLSLAVRKGKFTVRDREVGYIYLGLMIQTFMLVFMFEGTALYMAECMFTYFLGCAITAYYWHAFQLQSVKRNGRGAPLRRAPQVSAGTSQATITPR